uniref:SWI/SNF complex subunit SMARCC-1 n=1 Tax=Schmidtea mediterranea TaxID=79327 RepID=I1ZI88_SCHMD|nr:SWI/SNF complex subunit SMARCC-1 [Schmidtea mediterranea]
MLFLKKKDGLPNQRFYENPEIIALFDTVRTWLTRNCKKYWQNDPMTNKVLQLYVTNYFSIKRKLLEDEYLTFTACRRNLTGDVCSILRVHAFLEQWGLINYQVDQEGKITAGSLGPPNTSHFHVLTDSATGLQSLGNQASVVKSQSNNSAIDKQPTVTANPKDLSNSDNVNLQSKSADSNNETCMPSSISDYSLQTDQYINIASNRSDVNENSTGGVIDPPAGLPARSKEWSDQETLLLLEGLEMYKDDWNKVAEHVGSRTQEECILYFLRLPIEDPYLEGDAALMETLCYQPIPFSKSGNPIMSTVAFLASCVDPRIASEAAKAALNEFSRLKEEVPEYMVKEHKAKVTTAVESGKNVDPDKYGLEEVAGKDPIDKAKEGDNEEGAKEEIKVAVKENIDSSTSVKSETDNKVETESHTESEGTERMDSSENQPAVVEENEIKVESKDEEMQEKPISNEEEIKIFDKDSNSRRLAEAASVALAASATKARYLAQSEEKKIKGLVAQLVEAQLKKMEVKLKQFQELEAIIEREYEVLEQQRQQLLLDRQAFHMELLKTVESRARVVGHNQFHPINNINHQGSYHNASQAISQNPSVQHQQAGTLPTQQFPQNQVIQQHNPNPVPLQYPPNPMPQHNTSMQSNQIPQHNQSIQQQYPQNLPPPPPQHQSNMQTPQHQSNMAPQHQQNLQPQHQPNMPPIQHQQQLPIPTQTPQNMSSSSSSQHQQNMHTQNITQQYSQGPLPPQTQQQQAAYQNVGMSAAAAAARKPTDINFSEQQIPHQQVSNQSLQNTQQMNPIHHLSSQPDPDGNNTNVNIN